MRLPVLRRAEGREIDKRGRGRVLWLEERLQPRAPGAMARAARGGRTGGTVPWRGMEGVRGACDLPADAVRYVPNVQGVRAMATAHDFSAVDIDGHDKPLRTTPERCCWWSTWPRSAVSRRSMRACRCCGATIATAAWWCWVSPATSSATRSRATRRRSGNSVR